MTKLSITVDGNKLIAAAETRTWSPTRLPQVQWSEPKTFIEALPTGAEPLTHERNKNSLAANLFYMAMGRIPTKAELKPMTLAMDLCFGFVDGKVTR
jgi:hypothetical protein